jgi:tetratricopeptide (TPR) repeat protein
MTRREMLLAGLATVVALGAGIFFMNRNRVEGSRPPRVSQEFLSRYEKVRAAEKIADPLQRCLAYPDLSEFHWDSDVVMAFCRLSTRKMISWQQVQEAVDSHHTEFLDQEFDSYLVRNYQPGEHGFLTWAFRSAFSKSSEDVLNVAQRWIDQDPDSAFALTARGVHYVARAWEARGGEVAARTPRANFERMETFAAKARADLEEAVRRSPRMIVGYHELMEVAQLTNDKPLLESAVERALVLDRADQWIYDDWENAVQPKWGGSYDEMQGVANRAKRHTTENPLLKRVAARTICARADAESYSEETSRSALALYRNAAEIAPAVCFLKHAAYVADGIDGEKTSAIEYHTQAYRFLGDDEYLFRRALALQEIGKTDWALESIDLVQIEQPENVEAFNYKGWIFEADHRYAEAEKAFRAAWEIDPANREANTELFVLYNGALHDAAKAKDIIDRMMVANANNPRVWLLLSVLHSDTDEMQCRDDIEKYLQLVDEDNADSYEQRDIGRAKKRLEEIEKHHGISHFVRKPQ